MKIVVAIDDGGDLVSAYTDTDTDASGTPPEWYSRLLSDAYSRYPAVREIELDVPVEKMFRWMDRRSIARISADIDIAVRDPFIDGGPS